MTMLLKPPIPERKYVGTIVKVIVSMEISVNIHMTNWICFLSIETKMKDRCHYLFSMQSLTRIALITGAASGFGTATARLLASHGIKVACCDRSFIHNHQVRIWWILFRERGIPSSVGWILLTLMTFG